MTVNLHKLCQQTGFQKPTFVRRNHQCEARVAAYDLDAKNIFDRDEPVGSSFQELVRSSYKFARTVFAKPVLLTGTGADDERAASACTDAHQNLFTKWIQTKSSKTINDSWNELVSACTVTYTHDGNIAKEWVETHLKTKPNVGMDLEWNGSVLHVISLATSDNHALVWHDGMFDVHWLRDFVADDCQHKFFVDPKGDVEILRKCLKFADFAGIHDVKDYAQRALNLWAEPVGKAHLYRYLLNSARPSSSIRRGNWAVPRLSDKAIRYCAEDALCSLFFSFVLILRLPRTYVHANKRFDISGEEIPL